jgi:DNA-binding NtrC family response regulator
MASMRVLTSWIGHTDLRAMALDGDQQVRDRVAKIVGSQPTARDGIGPVKTILTNERFDHVFLLSNYSPDITKEFVRWLGGSPAIRQMKVENPTDHGEIFVKVDEAMKELLDGLRGKAIDLAILLSPGTPSMAAVWVLLGKTKYPARFYQTFDRKSWETNIPFDLAVDFVPELLHDADNLFHHLASMSPQEVEGFERIIGNSSSIRIAVGRARKAAMRDVPVILLGESGTGKEMFARAIHAASRRKNGPFVAVNCAAIPSELIESELFGHVRGAFTGADKARDGAFRQADAGVLFLDEIGELAPEVQAKLLRVLQPPLGGGLCVREFQPVGAAKPERSDVRVIAATNRNILGAVASGAFREDLYYRLAVINVKLPALRNRRSDLPELAKSILAQANKDFEAQEPGYKHKSFSDSAMSFVKRYEWPGNVRQLSNAILQAAVMAEGTSLTRADLEAAVSDMPSNAARPDPLEVPLGDGFSLEQHLDSIQAHFLARAMRQAGGTKSKAAALLGIKNYQTLDAQLKRLGVRTENDKQASLAR